MKDDSYHLHHLEVDTDEFLTHTLHYSLGLGPWNHGDGHTWVIEKKKLEEAKEHIIKNFKWELDKLISQAIEENLKNDPLVDINF